ncbi:unnamed protein product [Paramecium octaurelia]|uniref:Uncharacterized protein n=1 Tax=Paramecium octaurelia TaxID=43137 RepID=A0A8S1T4X5_PAROT|nr:unnamed protein product [Paramecium octaurelia]
MQCEFIFKESINLASIYQLRTNLLKPSYEVSIYEMEQAETILFMETQDAFYQMGVVSRRISKLIFQFHLFGGIFHFKIKKKVSSDHLKEQSFIPLLQLDEVQISILKLVILMFQSQVKGVNYAKGKKKFYGN